MLSPLALEALRDAASARASRALFSWFASNRLAGHGLDRSLGGHSGTIADLAAAVIEIVTVSPDAAEALVAHRLSIELLAGARNVGLRDYLLPQLLAGERAGAWPGRSMRALAEGRPEPVTGIDTGRGFRLTGILTDTSNLCAEAMILAVPVTFGDAGQVELILVSSDQDGMRPQASDGAWTGAMQLEQLYFREDELLGGDATALARRVDPLARALDCALAQGMLEASVALLSPGDVRSDLYASAVLGRRSLLSALTVASTWQSPVLLERWQRQFLDRAAAALSLAAEHPRAGLLFAITARRRAALPQPTTSPAA